MGSAFSQAAVPSLKSKYLIQLGLHAAGALGTIMRVVFDLWEFDALQKRPRSSIHRIRSMGGTFAVSSNAVVAA